MSQKEKVIRDFLVVGLFPTLVNKCFLLYFGANYAKSPGEGYGYGLAITIVIMIFLVGRFLWKYRNYDDA